MVLILFHYKEFLRISQAGENFEKEIKRSKTDFLSRTAAGQGYLNLIDQTSPITKIKLAPT